MECCRSLKELLEKYENTNEDVSEHDLLLFASTINEFSRQCKCLLKNPTLILPLENMLKKFYTFCISYMENLVNINEWNHEYTVSSELLFQAVCKSFQLQYPIYQAYESVKNNFELSVEQKEAIEKFCDVSENANASDLLFENIADFCEKKGVETLTECFKVKNSQMPLCVAGALISIIAQIRVWLNDDAIVRLIKPLSAPVSQYICNISEDDFRMLSARATAEVMLSTVKVQDVENLTCDFDILNIAFKFFMSKSLSVRMAGLNLFTNQIHYLIELGQNQLYGDVSSLYSQLSNWLNEKEIIQHLFGPNYHVELIKQSLFLLNFVAQERKLQPWHLDCIWSAAQLKHISRHVMDILITLAKTMDLSSVQYLLEQIANLPTASHTKQTLLLSSLFTRNIWSAGLTGSSPVEKKPIAHPIPLKKAPIIPKMIPLKQIQVSPMQSPMQSLSLSSDASTDEEEPPQFLTSAPIEQLNGLTDSKLRSLLPISPTPLEACLVTSSQESDINPEIDDGASSMTTNCSSPTERDQGIMEDLDPETVVDLPTVPCSPTDVKITSETTTTTTPITSPEQLPVEFDVETLCEPGKTLLWDLIQEEDTLLSEGIIDEAQKLLWQLICYSGNKKVRMVFIKGCLDNITKNKSVTLSLKILPKILSMFPHSSNTGDASKLLSWAVKDLHLMDCFFDNLKQFSSAWKSAGKSNEEECETVKEHEIQARLDFLTAMYSNEITPDLFRLSIEQVDCLWFCLVTQLPDTYQHLILSWLLRQTNSEELHALGLESFKHIFVNKLPELNAEKMTLTGLNLFQKLFGLTRLSNASPFEQETETEESLLGTEQLWNIALKAERVLVANETMEILNHLYLAVGESSVQKEKEFIQKCASVLMSAVHSLEENCLLSLRMIQQVLKILRNHLESYSKRFAYHLEMWRLAGKEIRSHQCMRKHNNKDHVLKIICQPMGMTEKVTFRMISSDLLAIFRARVTYWCCHTAKKDETINKDALAALKPPFRLISHGHELTPDLDMKTMNELGVRDQQLVYISVGNLRKDRMQNPSQIPASLLAAPNFESVPMIQLLKEENFLQLFNLLDVLYKISKFDDYKEIWSNMFESRHLDNPSSANTTLNDSDNHSDDQNELVKPISAEILLYNAWDLILLLPTNVTIKSRIVHGEFESPERWNELLNLERKFKLLYILQILDSLTIPLLKNLGGSEVNGDSSGDSDSSLSDVDKDCSPYDNCSLTWIRRLFKSGFVPHVLSLLLSQELDPKNTLDEWSLNGLAYIIKILTRIGLVDISYDVEDSPTSSSSSKGGKEGPSASAPASASSASALSSTVLSKKHVFRARYRSTEMENIVVINGLNELLMDTLDQLEEDVLITRFISILTYVSENTGETSNIGSQDVRASVVYHTLSFLVCWVTTRPSLREFLINHELFSALLIQIVFFSPQKSVRTEASRGIYKLCVSSGQQVLNKVLNQLLERLQELVSLQSDFRIQTVHKLQQTEKHHLSSFTSSLSNYKDYFWLLCRLINKYKPVDNEGEVISIRTAILQVSSFIQEEQAVPNHDGPTLVDHCLVGLIQTCTVLLQHDIDFKNSTQGYELMYTIFDKCLFNLPNEKDSSNVRPRCETKTARQAAFELLLQLVSHSKDSYLTLQNLLLQHHSMNKQTHLHSTYGWNYWPLEQERSSIGYVGLINLGATCYMASTVQQLFMIPEARSAILQTSALNDMKHSNIFREAQKMFAYLQASIRKAYNPKSFCKMYSMDKQPLNTGEQKDMTEFFTDFVSKLEEMSPNIKKMTRELLCGVITNNVISLDCSHVSKVEEEFYFVRCTVADMKNLYESLDEVTVKDVLEGDNKYTCSHCDAKVRAEKRACFKSLPKVLCFNTMRYTFNMVTMMKEKVNTHFSFPMKLNMATYTEEYLLKRKGEGDPDEIPDFWYNLVGVVVHTGTAEGGHYYSFIRDRTSKENCWYLFNDAEVKNFDPAQIAAECFGGEMTTKTFDAMTEKYMDFSFEKTHSAYMLFYEHCNMDSVVRLSPEKVALPKELQKQIWEDNYQFLQDKLVFDPSYFNFIWQFCCSIPKTIKTDVLFHTVKLAASFLLETLVHSREKLHMKGWVELLVHGFDRSQPACEWFLDHMAQDDWWIQQIMIKCPLQHIRQMFCQLCLMVIKNLRPAYVQYYTHQCDDDADEEHEVGSCSPITRFFKKLLSLLEDNIRSYCKHLSELFSFMYQYLSLGHEECGFLLKLDAITTFVQFYNCLKAGEVHEGPCDEDDDIELEDEEIITLFSDEKFYPTALDKMIGSINLLLEEARDGPELHLSESDMSCFASDKDFPFLHQITSDAINLRQTANIIFHLSCYNEPFAGQIVQMLINTAQRLPVEQSQPFFKLLSLLTDVAENGMPGLPSYIAMILPKLAKAIEANPAVTLDWLSTQVPRNKQAHHWVKENMEKWVEKYLVADNNPRVRGAASYLLVSLVPNHNFLEAFRGRVLSAPMKELKMSADAKNTVHEIFKFLLDMLSSLGKYCEKQLGVGTTRLVNFFTLLNYFCLSDEEKEIFTPYNIQLWNLYHPLMSEPDIAIHFNKQALLMFWYHVCEGCEQNIKFITNTDEVASSIAYNYILSNDDQEVISFNNATLPLYYGLLRLACAYSTTFCKALSSHPNMMWAFEYLIPRANQYTQAVDELVQLIRLFSGSTYTNENDMASAIKFRRKAIEIFCNCMDASHTWTTLVSILKLLIETEEDCVHVACSNGLNSLGESFSTLHVMYHEATACNVTTDIIEVTNLLHTVIECCFSYTQKTGKTLKSLQGWTDKIDIMMKALTMLNSYVPVDIHKASIELLSVLLQVYPEECIDTCAPIIHKTHLAIRMKESPSPLGPYFPRIGGQQKINHRKLTNRSGAGELNMTLHPRITDACNDDDKSYEVQLVEYFESYHMFVDKLCRYGLNLEPVPPIITDLTIIMASTMKHSSFAMKGCLLAVEVLPLKFHLFPKLWLEVWNKSTENTKYNSCIQQLLETESFVEFMDTLLTDERELLHDTVFYQFSCTFVPKIHEKVLVDQKQKVCNAIVTSLEIDTKDLDKMKNDEFELICPKIHGDTRALCLLLSVSGEDQLQLSETLDTCVEKMVNRVNRFKKDEEQKRMRKELEHKRRQIELEQQKHKQELEQRKRMQKAKEAASKTVDDSPETTIEPPVKKRKKIVSDLEKENNKKPDNLPMKPIEELEPQQPGPSNRQTKYSFKQKNTSLPSASHGDSENDDEEDEDSSDNISSDDFSSSESTSDSSSDQQQEGNKHSIFKQKVTALKQAVTPTVRKTCESLKGMLQRRRQKEKDKSEATEKEKDSKAAEKEKEGNDT